ncbi:MAG: nicotinate-nucleotide adenylyltransferase [Planctomycetaceae bacterium]
MRIGIYGGTFDPIHFGHLVLAETCREELQLDEVWFLPAFVSPHKRVSETLAAKERLAMVELAIGGHPAFRVDARELARGGPSYTVETLQELHRELPSDDLFFLMGADSLRDFPSWREPARILELATVVAVNRGRSLPEKAALGQTMGEPAMSRLRIVTMPGIDTSSTDLRLRVRTGRSIRYLTPRGVEEYIRHHQLYRDPS